MSADGGQHCYKIPPWVTRIAVPVVVAAAAAVVIATNDYPAATVPLIVVIGVLAVVAAERRCVISDADGVHSRGTRRESTFSVLWADIDHFEMIEHRARVAVVMHLHTGEHRALPSTRAWSLQRTAVAAVKTGLDEELTGRAFSGQ